MKYSILILLFGVAFSCGTKRSKEYIFKGDIKSDLHFLLCEGSVRVDVMGLKEPSVEYKTIVNKFQQAVQSNQEWFSKFQKENYLPGQGLPYHENFGISPQEYEKLKTISNQNKLIKIGNGTILIEREGEIILIKAFGNLSAFNDTKIDLETKTAYFENIKIPYSGLSNVSDTSNTIGKWKGYKWKLEEMQNPNYKSVQEIDGKIFELIVGQV